MNGITSGQIYRSWFYLWINFFLSIMYFTFLATGFSLAGSLLIFVIGFPILLFMFAASRGLAAFDRQISAAVLNIEASPFVDNLDLRGMNFGSRLGATIASPTTWLSIAYLLLKFPLSIIGFTVVMAITPFLILEMLLAEMGIHFGMISGRIVQAVAVGSFVGTNAMLTPKVLSRRVTVATEKTKNRQNEADMLHAAQRLGDVQTAYFIDDDGEIAAYPTSHKAKNDA